MGRVGSGLALGWVCWLAAAAAAQALPEATALVLAPGPEAAVADVDVGVEALPEAEAEAGPQPAPQPLQQGLASFYHHRFHGRRTASGERYNRHALTAAHPTLPFGTEIVVRSLRTGREVVVRVTDRGPHLARRIIDLSHAAAVALGIQRHGVSEVQLWALPAHPP